MDNTMALSPNIIHNQYILSIITILEVWFIHNASTPHNNIIMLFKCGTCTFVMDSNVHGNRPCQMCGEEITNYNSITKIRFP